MPKLTIPQRQSNQDDATYAQIVQNSIREQRPYLSDDDVVSLAQVKISSVPSVQPTAQPKVQAAAKVEKPQPFKSTAEMVDKFVPKQQVTAPKTLGEAVKEFEKKKVVTDPMESGVVARDNTIKQLPEQPAMMPELGDPNVAAGTVKMLEKFIPPQQPQEELPPTEIGGFSNPYDANLPTQENFDPTQAKRVIDELPSSKSVSESFIAQPQVPQTDVFDDEAIAKLPQGSPNERMVYADVLRKNDDKIKIFEASKVAAQMPTDDFDATINKKDLTLGNVQRASLMKAKGGGDMSAIEGSLNEYQETPEFKRDVIKVSKGDKSKFNEAARLVLDNKANEFTLAPTKLQKKMQNFSDWAAENNAPLYATTKTLGAAVKGLTDVGAFGASLIGATARSMGQVLDNKEVTMLDNFAQSNAKAQKMSSGYLPQVQSEKASGITQGLSDVTSIVAAIATPMSVVKPVSVFTKAKNLLSLGKSGTAATELGLSAEAQIAAKTTSGANKTLMEAAKILQSKPANMTAQVLDGAATNWVIMGSAPFDGQRQKYLDMGFSEEQANRRAFGMTSLTNLLLAMPNVLRPHEMSVTEKVFSTGSKKETLKASLKQAAYFGGDMTLLRGIEETIDDNARREQGIKIENVPFSQLIQENGKKALVDAGAGFVMGLMARGKYKQSDMQLNGIVEAYKNPEALSLDIQSRVASGKMTKEQAKTFENFLTTIEPQYQKLLNETTTIKQPNGEVVEAPRFTPQNAVRIAVERTKAEQAAKALESLDASVEKKSIYETNDKGEVIKKTVYRHKDGKLYDTEEASTKGRRVSLLAAKTNAEQRARRIEAGYVFEGKLIAGWEMADMVDANSLNGKAKEGQREAIVKNAPYEAVEINVNDFAKQTEIVELVSQIEEGKLDVSNIEENNLVPPIIDAEGNVIDGKKIVAKAIVESAFERSGGKITFMKPIGEEVFKEAANEAFETKIGDTSPKVTDKEQKPLPENEKKGVIGVAEVFDKVIENGGDAAEGLVEAAKEGLQAFVEPEIVAERLSGIKGEDTFSEPIIEAAIREAQKPIKEPVLQEIETISQDGRTELESIVGGSESEKQQSEGTTSGTEQSDVRAVEANKEGQEAEQPTEVVVEETIATPSESVTEVVSEPIAEKSPKEEPKPAPSIEIPKPTIDEVMIEGEGRTLKTLPSRVMKGQTVENTKQAVEAKGLERVVDDFVTAEINAKNLVEKYGYDIALSKAIEGEIDGAARSAILGMEYLRRDDAVRMAKTATELRKATEDLAEWISYVGYLQAKGGSANAYWGKFYADNPNLGLTLKDKIDKWEQTSGKAIPIDIKEQYEKIDAELKVALERVKELEAQQPTDEIMKAIKAIQEQEAKKASKPSLTKEQRNRTSDKLMALAEKIRKSETSGLALSTPIPPHIISDSVKLLAQGVKVGEAIGDTMAKIYKLIEGGIKKKLTEEEKKKVSDYFTSQLEENVETDSQTGNPITHSVIRDYVLQGFNTPEKLLEKLKEHYPNLSDREVMDLVSNYGKQIQKTSDEIDREISLIKNIFKTKSQLEDIAQGIRPKKRILKELFSPDEKAKQDVRDAQVRKNIRDVRQALDKLKVDLPTLDEDLRTRIDKQEAALSNKIQDLELAIKDGKEITKNEKTKLTSEKIQALEEQLEDTRKVYNEVFGKEPMSEGERKLKSLQTQLESLYTEKEAVEKAEPQYPASEIMDIEALQNEIAARKKALRLEGTEMQTAEDIRVEKLQKQLDAIGKEKPTTEKEVIDRSQREIDIIKQIESSKAKLAEAKKIAEIDAKIAETEKNIEEQNFESAKKETKEKSDAVQKKIDELSEARNKLKEEKKAFEKSLKTDEQREIEKLERQLALLKSKEPTEQAKKDKKQRSEKEIELLEGISAEKERLGLKKTELETKLIAKEKQIQKLRDKLDGVEVVEPEKQKIFSEELDKLDAEAEALRRQIREQKPKSQKVPYSLDAVNSAIDANKFKLKGAEADLEIVRKRGQDTSKIEADIDRYSKNIESLTEMRTELEAVEAKRILQTLKNLANRKEHYEQRKTSGQFAKKPKNVLPETTELTKARSEVDRLKFDEQKLMYLAEKEAMSGLAKTKELVWGLWNVPRLALATGEWSFVGMQGRRLTASYLLKNPQVVKEAFKNAAKSWYSGEFAQEMESRMKNSPEYHIYKGAGLDLTEQSFKQSANEEIAYNNIGKIFWRFLNAPDLLAERIYKFKTGKDLGLIEEVDKFNPLVKFERAASGYLNTLRFAAMTDMVGVLRQEGLTFEKNKQDYQAAARYINTATGRGGSGIKSFQSAAETLSKIFFSPKMFMTELQLATTPLGGAYIASMKDPSNVAKKEAFKHQLRYVSSLLLAGASATGLAYLKMGSTDENEDGTGVEFNPASANYGKIVFPNGRTVDMFNGAQRYVVVYDRLLGQQKFKNKRGEIKDVGVKGTPSKYDIIANIPKNKVNPALGFLVGALDAQRKNISGSEKYDDYGQVWNTEEELNKLSSPIFFQMINNAYEQDPTILDGFGAFMAFFGKGFNVQEKPKPKPIKTKSKKSNYGFRYNP